MSQSSNPMPMRPNRPVFSTLDRDGNEVRLTESQWLGHILFYHPDMESRLEEIQRVIRNPEIVRLGDRGEIRLASLGAVASRPGRYLRVIVVYSDEITGIRLGSVRTAHLSKLPPKGVDII